jgi:uncharacterized membrane protein
MPEQEQARASESQQDADSTPEGVQDVADKAEATQDDVRDKGQQTAEQTIRDELSGVVREAAIEVLSPVARKATTSAAKYAVTKAPDLMKDKVVPAVTSKVVPAVKDKLVPAVSEAGGPMALAKKAGDGAGQLASKLKRDKGGGPTGTGRGRRLPIQESIDVAVPLDAAYNQFTQFEGFPEFMHRVERLEQKDDTHLMWHENIWGVRRQWEAEITDQRPNERIAWESTSGSPQQKGVVTFHRLSDRLTRVMVDLDQQPKGLFEKTSSGFRMTRRALRSDLMRFKAFIEFREDETGAWRGEVEEGEVAGREGEEPEEGREEEGPTDEERAGEPEAEEEEEPEAEEEPELKAEEEEQPEAEEEEELEAEEEPEPEAEEEPEPEAEEEPEPEPEPEEEPVAAAEEQEERPRRRPRRSKADGGEQATAPPRRRRRPSAARR